jgi:hypothetical protein
MATLWRFPLQPTNVAAATPATGAIGTTLQTATAGLPLPQLPPIFQPGGRLILECNGEITTTSATPTLIAGFYIGSVGQATTSKTALAITTTMALPSSVTAGPFIMYYSGTIRGLGPSAGVIHGQGYCLVGSSLTAFNAASSLPVTQALRTVSTLDLSQTNELDIGITFSSNTGTPSITITDFWADLSG